MIDKSTKSVIERKWSELAYCRHQPAYAGVYPWYYALDIWEMDCRGRSTTPILSSQHFSHNMLLIRWVGGTRAWTRNLSVRNPNKLIDELASSWRLHNVAQKGTALHFNNTLDNCKVPPNLFNYQVNLTISKLADQFTCFDSIFTVCP